MIQLVHAPYIIHSLPSQSCFGC